MRAPPPGGGALPDDRAAVGLGRVFHIDTNVGHAVEALDSLANIANERRRIVRRQQNR